MRRPDRSRYDFASGTWVRDDFLTPDKPHAPVELPEPATPPAPGRWTAPPPSIPRLTPVHYAIGILVATGVLLALVFHVPGAVIYVAFALPTHIWKARRTDAPRLIEDPDDLEVCVVELAVWRDEACVGRDRGVAWFQDGGLLFSGHRTSFALGGEDVLPRSRWRLFDRADGTSRLPDDAVPLRVGSGNAYVVLTPVSLPDDVSQKREMRFLKALYAFRRAPTPSSGPRQWPPLERWES